MCEWQQLKTMHKAKAVSLELIFAEESTLRMFFWTFIEKGQARWFNQIYTACFRHMWE
jgi:hypothetical protein